MFPNQVVRTVKESFYLYLPGNRIRIFGFEAGKMVQKSY